MLWANVVIDLRVEIALHNILSRSTYRLRVPDGVGHWEPAPSCGGREGAVPYFDLCATHARTILHEALASAVGGVPSEGDLHPTDKSIWPRATCSPFISQRRTVRVVLLSSLGTLGCLRFSS